MATTLRRLTFVVTTDMEEPLDRIKQELFYDKTQSDMIRELIYAGLQAIKDEKNQKKQ